MKNTKILFVCLGNICRSPLAEAIFNHRINKKGLSDKVEVDSCGTSNYHIGDEPDTRTRMNAKKNGVAMEHLGRQLTVNDLDYYDFIVAMDRSNYNNIVALDKERRNVSKVRLMRAFGPVKNEEEVPDPYYGTEDDFQEVFDILDRSIDSFILYLENEHFKV